MWANHTGAFAILQSLDDGDAMAKYSVVEESMVKDPTNASVWTHLFGDYVRGVVWDTLAWTWSAEIDWTIQRDAATSEAEKETFIGAGLQGAGILYGSQAREEHWRMPVLNEKTHLVLPREEIRKEGVASTRVR